MERLGARGSLVILSLGQDEVAHFDADNAKNAFNADAALISKVFQIDFLLLSQCVAQVEFGESETRCYVLVRWLQITRTDYLPPDTLFAVRREGELLHLTLNKEMPMPREQVSNLMLALSEKQNGPSDIR